jgi:hypothetical protein
VLSIAAHRSGKHRLQARHVVATQASPTKTTNACINYGSITELQGALHGAPAFCSQGTEIIMDFVAVRFLDNQVVFWWIRRMSDYGTRRYSCRSL